jgi:hypothetical protein
MADTQNEAILKEAESVLCPDVPTATLAGIVVPVKKLGMRQSIKVGRILGDRLQPLVGLFSDGFENRETGELIMDVLGVVFSEDTESDVVKILSILTGVDIPEDKDPELSEVVDYLKKWIEHNPDLKKTLHPFFNKMKTILAMVREDLESPLTQGTSTQ